MGAHCTLGFFFFFPEGPVVTHLPADHWVSLTGLQGQVKGEQDGIFRTERTCHG